MTKHDCTVKVVLCVLCVICIVFVSAVFVTDSSHNGMKTEQTLHWILAVIIVSAVLLVILIALAVAMCVTHHKRLHDSQDDIDEPVINDSEIHE